MARRDASDATIVVREPDTGEVALHPETGEPAISTAHVFRPFVVAYLIAVVAVFWLFWPILTAGRITDLHLRTIVWFRAGSDLRPARLRRHMARREHVRIPMTDGISLSATLFFPENARRRRRPWPAIMEALPYRKDDAVAGYEATTPSSPTTGYVSCRLDIRGTGSSGGITTDEYSADERRDLVEVIDWLATQDWSSGNVGMFGTSYGGFNSLQAALENPPALKAIVPIFASDDRYDDDVHYYGGALKHVDLVDYPTYMVAMNALPPVPASVGRGLARRVAAPARAAPSHGS